MLQLKTARALQGRWEHGELAGRGGVDVLSSRQAGVPSLQWTEPAALQAVITPAHSSASSRDQTTPIPICTPPLKPIDGAILAGQLKAAEETWPGHKGLVTCPQLLTSSSQVF